jgi:hypothetical protein
MLCQRISPSRRFLLRPPSLLSNYLRVLRRVPRLRPLRVFLPPIGFFAAAFALASALTASPCATAAAFAGAAAMRCSQIPPGVFPERVGIL